MLVSPHTLQGGDRRPGNLFNRHPVIAIPKTRIDLRKRVRLSDQQLRRRAQHVGKNRLRDLHRHSFNPSKSILV